MITDTIKTKTTVSTKETPNKTYNYEEVLDAAVLYFSGDRLAATTWMNKYALKDKTGAFLELTPADMHIRLAREFSRIEEKYTSSMMNPDQTESLSDYGKKRKKLTERRIFNLFEGFRYIVPQGSVMAGLGNPYMLASLSNCVVLPKIHDSYGGIFYTDQQLAQLFKRRCGVGIDISTLRPKGEHVSNAAGSTSGAVTFMERYSNTTREVAQNGRRGALMITMDVRHPDIEDFVTVKQDLKKITGANVSLRISDDFMKAVETDSNFMLRWPVDSSEPEITKEIKARDLWTTIIQSAHNTAEPGLIFWDRQHKYSTSSVYPGYENVSTNPCSEIAMQGGDSCRLIAINLYSFVKNPFTEKAKFDFKKLYEVSYEGQRLMDNLVDLELEAIDRVLNKVDQDPEPDEIKAVERNTWKLLHETGKKGRRTGLGFTALADAVAAMGIKFDSSEAVELIEKMMKVKCEAEFNSSVDMAVERGPFEEFNADIEQTSEFVGMMKEELPKVYKRMMEHGRRNISLSTVAPTGSISLLTQTSSGIEPVFMPSYKRRRKIHKNDNIAKVDFMDEHGDIWQEFTVYHPKLKNWMEINGDENISNSPYHGASAMDIDWMKRLEIQSVVQKYITHSISSTINLPNDVSIEKVKNIYMNAWKKGLKGITVYRDGSRSGVLISDGTGKTKETEIIETNAPRRPKSLKASVVRFQNHHEKWIAVVGLLNNKPYEIFTGKAEDSFHLPQWVERGWIIKNRGVKGVSRYDFQYADREGYKVTIEGLSRSFDKEFWNYAKLISGVLRHGMPIQYVVTLVSNLHLYDDSINTWKNGIERALRKFIPNGTVAKDHKCPDCGDPDGLIYEEGCLKCKSCGKTKCG